MIRERSGGASFQSFKFFEKHFQRYDKWYNLHPNHLYRELECLEETIRHASQEYGLEWPPGEDARIVEVGVGTGVFSHYLDIPIGLDPASSPLKIARQRGVIHALKGVAEHLPFRSNSIDMVLFVVTLCFVNDPLSAVKEASRILKRGGVLINCIVPRESLLGIEYMKKSSFPISFYKYARFLSTRDVLRLILKTNLTPTYSCKTLEWGRPVLNNVKKEAIIEPPIFADTPQRWGFQCILSQKR